MDASVQTFCIMIRNRSEENRRAIYCFHCQHDVLSPAFSILRLELDSMVRVIYLLSINDLAERQRLIESSLSDRKWDGQTANGKWRKVTDRDMVDLAQKLQGWTQSVYKFGCAFVHLSDFHNHFAKDSFRELPQSEKMDILLHMRSYHGGPCNDDPDMAELSMYIPMVFNKISDNLKCYLESLERNEMLKDW